MSDVIADKNYYFDAEGNVTTDEAASTRWLAREGANVLPEFRDALTAFQGLGNEEGSSAEGDEAEAEVESDDEKADSPKANKADKPASNKGVK